jgi:hypothetical protein
MNNYHFCSGSLFQRDILSTKFAGWVWAFQIAIALCALPALASLHFGGEAATLPDVNTRGAVNVTINSTTPIADGELTMVGCNRTNNTSYQCPNGRELQVQLNPYTINNYTFKITWGSTTTIEEPERRRSSDSDPYYWNYTRNTTTNVTGNATTNTTTTTNATTTPPTPPPNPPTETPNVIDVPTNDSANPTDNKDWPWWTWVLLGLAIVLVLFTGFVLYIRNKNSQ